MVSTEVTAGGYSFHLVQAHLDAHNMIIISELLVLININSCVLSGHKVTQWPWKWLVSLQRHTVQLSQRQMLCRRGGPNSLLLFTSSHHTVGVNKH